MTGLSLSEKVLIGTSLLGGMSGVVGSFAVLRRRALVGDMLAHAALPGVCLAFLLLGTRELLGLSLGALATGLLAIAAVTVITRWTRTKEDAAIGIVLSTFFGAGVVLLSMIQKPGVGGNKAGLGSYLFGEPGNMLTSDLVLLAIVAIFVLATVLVFFKEFQLVAFDADFAQSQGWPTLWLDLAMMTALAVVTIVGLPIVGVILMAAMIILPAATARFWTNRLPVMLVLAGLIGVASGVIGSSIGRDLPAGAVIVLVAAMMFGLSLLFAPQRGVVPRALAEWRLRQRISREHLLRSLYELGEPLSPPHAPVPVDLLRAYRYWQPRALDRLMEWAIGEELVKMTETGAVLTTLGLRHAAELTKAHRLWELYLMQHADIAADHVDRDADDTEHLLPESVLLELERELAAEGRLPKPLPQVPESPHDLESLFDN